MLNEAYKRMPIAFTSSDFYKAMRKIGCPEKEVQSGVCTVFLKENATMISDKKKSWIKPNTNGQAAMPFVQHDTSEKDETVILNKALSEMPIKFTSHQFAERAKQMGLKQSTIDNKGARFFLTKKTIQIGRQSWIKKDAKTKTKEAIEEAASATYQFTEEEAIAFLKAKGYRIQKMQWQEI